MLSLTPDDAVRGTGLAFVCCAVMAGAALVACWDLDGPQPRAMPAGGEGEQRVLPLALVRTPGVPGSVLASRTLIAAVDILIACLPLIGEQRGITPGTVGLLLGLRAATSLASRLLLAQLVARWSRASLIATSTAVSGLSLVLVTLPVGAVPLGVVLALLGLVAGVGQPLTMSHLVGLTPARARGTALGLRFTGNRAGQAVLPLAAGGITADVGVSAAFLLLSALLGGRGVLLRRQGRSCAP